MFGKDKKKQNRIGMAAATVILASCAGYLYLSEVGAYKFDENAVDGSFEMSADQVAVMPKELQEAARETSVQIQINATPEVDSFSKRCNLMVENPAENNQDFRVTVTLDDSQKILYQSRILKPGERLVYVVLDAVPQSGEHPATAEFAVLNPETGEAVGAVEAGLLLTVN